MATQYFGFCDPDTGAVGTPNGDDEVTATFAVWDNSTTYTCPGSGSVTLTALELWCYSKGGGTGMRIGLYNSSGTTLITAPTKMVPIVNGSVCMWQGTTGLSVALTGGTAYRFLVTTDATGTGIAVKAGTGASGVSQYNGVNYTAAMPEPMPSATNDTFIWPFRATVTTGSGLSVFVVDSTVLNEASV